MAHKRTLKVCGDTLAIEWNGAWVSPSNGEQHSRSTDAMRVELEAYYSACGEDVADESIAAEIDSYLDKMAE